ncbi:MAG: hypothetical protein U0003_04730 [Vampirovibrionales bacterium]
MPSSLPTAVRTSGPQPSAIAFGHGAQALSQLGLSKAQQWATRAMLALEKNQRYGTGKFVEDTLSSMGSRLLISSSKAERFEIAPTELLESVAVYFGLPGLAKALAQPFAKLAKLNPALLFKPLDTLAPSELASGISARLATLLAPFSAMLLGVEGPLMHGKNILTTRLFGKGSFEGMLNMGLTQDSAQTVEQTESKAKRQILRCLAGVVLCALGSVGLAAWGPRVLGRLFSPQQLSQATRYLKGLDVMGHGKGVDFGKLILGSYMALSSLIYLDASRGTIERKEILPRFALIISYLLFFKELLERRIIKPQLSHLYAGFYPNHSQRVVSTHQLLAQPAFRALNAAQKSNILRAKTIAFLLPYVVGTGLFGVVNAGLNRYLSRRRIQAQNSQLQQWVSSRVKKLQPSFIRASFLANRPLANKE